MLLEFWNYLTTPCMPEARRMGHLSELIAVDSRFHRCGTAWEPHLERCRRFIRRTVEGLPPARRGTALVCGAGLCNDIPLAALAFHFARVLLVDLVFLRSTRRETDSYKNVRIFEADLTGGLVRLVDARLAGRFGELTSALRSVASPPTFAEVGTIDLVVSANVLSQLPLPFCDRVRARAVACPGDPEAADDRLEPLLATFSAGVRNRHLAWLQEFTRNGSSVILLTDVKRKTVAPGRTLVGESDLLPGIALPEAQETWEWDIAPAPEEHPAHDIRHTVHAARFGPSASAT